MGPARACWRHVNQTSRGENTSGVRPPAARPRSAQSLASRAGRQRQRVRGATPRCVCLRAVSRERGRCELVGRGYAVRWHAPQASTMHVAGRQGMVCGDTDGRWAFTKKRSRHEHPTRDDHRRRRADGVAQVASCSVPAHTAERSGRERATGRSGGQNGRCGPQSHPLDGAEGASKGGHSESPNLHRPHRYHHGSGR